MAKKAKNTERTNDVYDREVKYLARHPEKLWRHWSNSTPLFQYANPDNASLWRRPDGKFVGCLTQIRQNDGVAWTPSLTNEIRRDKRLPTAIGDGFDDKFILMSYRDRVLALEPFAEWQRRLDKELGREPPKYFEPSHL